MSMIETSLADLNPAGNEIHMEAADRAIEAANEIENSNSPGEIIIILEQLSSALDALSPLVESLGVEVKMKCSALEHEMDRLKKISAQHH